MPKNATNNTHQSVSRQQRNPGHNRTWWFEHYQAWQQSGQSKTSYCNQQGLNLSTFVNCSARGQGKRAGSSKRAGSGLAIKHPVLQHI
jgi:hypothetical protein